LIYKENFVKIFWKTFPVICGRCVWAGKGILGINNYIVDSKSCNYQNLEKEKTNEQGNV
jgi:hypothetical protein